MIKVGAHVVLSLWDERHFEAEVGPIARGEGVAPFTIAHNVPTRRRSSPRSTPPAAPARTRSRTPVEREWGGLTGYFGDPDGYRWEVA